MTTMNGYVKNNRIVLDSDLLSFDGKKVMITFYDEGENPYDLEKPIPEKVMKKLKEFVRRTTECFGSHLEKIILFGSYARGDYRGDSDVDVMVLTDYAENEVNGLDGRLSDIAFDVSYEFDAGEGDEECIVINPLMYSMDYFERWKKGENPFFDNVRGEGVRLYEK